MMDREASSLLYSYNIFRFPEVFIVAPSVPTSAHIRLFLDQIRSYAKLIRHMCIPFPSF